MAYSNQTANYGLPQYVGSDLATWQDNTEAWAKVDAAMQANKLAAQAASTAAGQAQATANAAQSAAGAANSKAQDVADSLVFSVNALSATANVNSTQASKLVTSDIIGVMSFSMSTVEKSSITTFSADASTTGVTVYTTPNNIFSLPMSTGADSSKRFYIGSVPCFISRSGTLTLITGVLVGYWDGSKTNVFIGISNSTYTGLQATDSIICFVNSSWALTGSIISVSA